jgi:hypothetical protein
VAFYSPESIHLADILTITAIIIVGAIAVEAMALDDTVAADIVVVQPWSKVAVSGAQVGHGTGR